MWIPSPLRLLLAAGLAVTVGVAGGCSGGSPSHHSTTPPAGASGHATDRAAGQPDFAVVSDRRGFAVVGADAMVHAVPGLPADPDGMFAYLDADRVAFVSSGFVGILHADGTATTKDCPGCAGLAVTPQGLMTAQDDHEPGFGFDLVTFDDSLAVTARAAARRIVERPADSTRVADVTPATLLGVSGASAYVGYLSRNGGARVGPTVIAAYGVDGRLRASEIDDAQLEDAALSPGGRYLALSMGGEGGACVLTTHLTVLDTRTLSDLTGPAQLPQNVQLPLGGEQGTAWFTGALLRWTGSSQHPTVTDVGGIHVPDSSGCDPNPTIYSRHYDPTARQARDDGPLAVAQLGWFGPACGAGLYLAGIAPDPRLSVQGPAGTVPLDPRWNAVRAAPAPPADCPS